MTGYFTYAPALQSRIQDAEARLVITADVGYDRGKAVNLKSVVDQLRDYRENLKFVFLFKLVENTADHLTHLMFDRFQVFFTDIAAVAARLDNTQSDKERTSKILNEMNRRTADVKERIAHLRRRIQKTD